MEKHLPDYLQYHVDGAANKESIVECGDMRFTVITPRLIRIEQGRWTDRATLIVVDRSFEQPLFTVQLGERLLIVTDALEITYRLGAALSADSLLICGRGQTSFRWRYGDHPVFNLGGTTSTLDGVDGECQLTDDGMCSLDGYTLLDDSRTPIIREDGWFEKRTECTDIYFFGFGHDYEASVQAYYRLTGVPQMLPAFALGNWWSRYYKYTASSYLDLMDRFRDHDVPLSVGIVDMDWHLTDGAGRVYRQEGWTGYTWNRDLFPDDRAFIEALHTRNLRTALNLHPAGGVQSHEEMYEDMAKRMGIDPATGQRVPCEYLDPNFLQAYFELLHFPYEENGVDFWWLDWQQGSDYRTIVGDAKYMPNALEEITPLWMLNHMHYLASKRNGKRGLLFSRYSGYGSQRYPIGFSGDTVISWESLKFQPYFTVTASNLGYGWWSHDIGGHMGGLRDDELTARWIQFGVFSPIFRLHSSDNPFSGREPWNYNQRVQTIIEDYMRLRHRLFPYLYTMCYRNCEELIPLMRPMYHTHAENAEAYTVKNQYWFGSEMVVAPITDKQNEISALGHTKIWLPEGTWVDAFTGYIYQGGETYNVYRPMEQIPVFLKAGAIVPMQRHMQHQNDLGRSETLDVWIASGASNKFVLYEDDGETLNYKQEQYCNTEFVLDWTNRQATLSILPVQGKGELLCEKRNYQLCFRGFAAGSYFTLTNDEKLNDSFDPATCTYKIQLQDVDVYQGITVQLNNASFLLHRNDDWKKRIIDVIMHAQCGYGDKEHIFARVEKLMEAHAGKKKIRECDIDIGCNGDLAKALLEILLQVPNIEV